MKARREGGRGGRKEGGGREGIIAKGFFLNITKMVAERRNQRYMQLDE